MCLRPCRLDVAGQLVVFILLLVLTLDIAECNHDAKRLYDELMIKHGYNKLVRPVANFTQAVKVKFGLRFAQLHDVDEKNEIMTTSMWVTQEWNDIFLQWNKEEYGGLETIYVHAEQIWRPDVVLYNNADGDFTITILTKASLSHTGDVHWNAPAVFKSKCDIDVEYFPFDLQVCRLTFLAWSHDINQIDMVHLWKDDYATDSEAHTDSEMHPFIPVGIDMRKYVKSQEWDVLDVPAQRNHPIYPCCPNASFPDITFNVTLRRKTVFYTVNIIVPCVCINLLTLTGFYVPCDCGEKIPICMTILLSLSMFQLLLFDLVPGTSLTVPMLGKYILFTMVVISGSVVCQVIIRTVNNRAYLVGEMPKLARWLFVDMMARVLCIPQLTEEEQDMEIEKHIDWSLAQSDLSRFSNPYKMRFRQRKSLIQETTQSLLDPANTHSPFWSHFLTVPGEVDNAHASGICQACEALREKQLIPPNAHKAFEGVNFISNHFKEVVTSRKVRGEWVHLAMVMDRLLLWLYVAMLSVCTMVFLLRAPALYDHRASLGPDEDDW